MEAKVETLDDGPSYDIGGEKDIILGDVKTNFTQVYKLAEKKSQTRQYFLNTYATLLNSVKDQKSVAKAYWYTYYLIKEGSQTFFYKITPYLRLLMDADYTDEFFIPDNAYPEGKRYMNSGFQLLYYFILSVMLTRNPSYSVRHLYPIFRGITLLNVGPTRSRKDVWLAGDKSMLSIFKIIFTQIKMNYPSLALMEEDAQYFSTQEDNRSVADLRAQKNPSMKKRAAIQSLQEEPNVPTAEVLSHDEEAEDRRFTSDRRQNEAMLASTNEWKNKRMRDMADMKLVQYEATYQLFLNEWEQMFGEKLSIEASFNTVESVSVIKQASLLLYHWVYYYSFEQGEDGIDLAKWLILRWLRVPRLSKLLTNEPMFQYIAYVMWKNSKRSGKNMQDFLPILSMSIRGTSASSVIQELDANPDYEFELEKAFKVWAAEVVTEEPMTPSHPPMTPLLESAMRHMEEDMFEENADDEKNYRQETSQTIFTPGPDVLRQKQDEERQQLASISNDVYDDMVDNAEFNPSQESLLEDHSIGVPSQSLDFDDV
jgi:hypothetical protein